jgi:hypothetical protein
VNGGIPGAATLEVETEQNNWISESRNKQVLSKIAVKLLETDPKLGKDVIRQWENWKRDEDDMDSKADHYEDLDQYLTDRFGDVAWG